jgi:hypothetical protein
MDLLKLQSVVRLQARGVVVVAGEKRIGSRQAVRLTPASLPWFPATDFAGPTDPDNPGTPGMLPGRERAGRSVSQPASRLRRCRGHAKRPHAVPAARRTASPTLRIRGCYPRTLAG